MAKITVYHYELEDPYTGVSIRSRHPATRRAIDAARGQMLPDTATDVPLEWVSDDGVVMQWPIPEHGRGSRVAEPLQPK